MWRTVFSRFLTLSTFGQQTFRGRFALTLILVSISSIWARLEAAQMVVVTKDEGGYHFTAVEEFSINAKPRVRVLPAETIPSPNSTGASNPAPKTLQPKETDRLPEMVLAQLVLFRKSEDGSIYSFDATSHKWSAVAPEGLSLKAPEALSAIWSRSQFASLLDRKAKTGSPVPYDRLFAVVAGQTPAEALSELATKSMWWNVPGTIPAKRFDERMGLLAAFVKAYPNDSQRVRKHLTESLQNYSDLAGAGGAYAVLEYAQRWVAVSESVFPDDAAQQKLRTSLRKSKLDIDQRAAVLNALGAGELWEPFLTQYRSLEPYETAFKTLAETKRKALEQSTAEHRGDGDWLAAAKDYAAAAAQYKLALKRNPSDPGAQKGLEAVRLQATRQGAQKRLASSVPRDPNSATQIQVQRHLDLAQRYTADQKFADAEAELKTAAQVDAASPGITLAQARLLAAQKDLRASLATLDRYDTVAITDGEFAAGEKLRGQLLYDRKNYKDLSLQQVQAHFDGQAFAKALEVATNALGMDPEDGDFLYYAGVSAGILRRREEARKLLDRYLDVSDTLSADAQRRSRSRLLLRQLAKSPPVVAGQPHWFSGFNVTEDVFYCPTSLIFRPRIAAVKASKLNVSFEWQGSKLKAVHSLWENKHTGFNAFSAIMGGVAAGVGQVAEVTNIGAERQQGDFFFDYYSDFPQVLRISNQHSFSKDGDTVSQVYTQTTGATATAPGITTAHTDVLKQDSGSSSSSGNWSFITLQNNPRVDPEMAVAATGHRISQGFAPNLYFHPFAWDEIYLFEFAYDPTGRVVYAWCKNPPNNVPPTARYEFEWDGFRLMKITQRADSKPDAPILYERTLNYSGGKLVSESISFAGKHAKIDYKYNGNKLMEAVGDADPSLNNLSPHATFVD